MTVPFNVAVVAVTALAAPVVAAGGPASAVPGAAKPPIATQIARAVFLMPTPFGPFPLDAREAPRLEAGRAPRRDSHASKGQRGSEVLTASMRLSRGREVASCGRCASRPGSAAC